MECYTCHTSWTNSCAGCHLPIEANWKTERHHYEGGETRNFATYNPQVARDDMFLLGRRGPSEGSKIAPVRSSSALVLSSTNSNRERIYVQQPPIAASGFSSQAFNPHYPHTERKTETKTCSDCHLSGGRRQQRHHGAAAGARDELRQLRRLQRVGRRSGGDQRGAGHGMGRAAGGHRQLSASLRVSGLVRGARSEWPTNLKTRTATARATRTACSCAANTCMSRKAASGARVYDVASIGNKGVSRAIITAPFSPLGQDTHIALEGRDLHRAADESADQSAAQRRRVDARDEPGAAVPSDLQLRVITDAKEGLILTDVTTLADGEPRNNHLQRALTWNPTAACSTGARHVTLGGYYAYVIADARPRRSSI